MRVSDASRASLSRLNRREWTYWLLSSLLLLFLSATVIFQFLTADEPYPARLIDDKTYQRVLLVGLPGLVILFSLYIALKRREILDLKSALFDQKALLESLEERTAELERTLEELKRVNDLKDMLLSTVSHELKTPLTSIHSVAQILLEYGDKDLHNLAFEKPRSIVGDCPARKSKVLAILEDGTAHKDVRLDDDSMDRLITWMDTYAHRLGHFSDEQEEELRALRQQLAYMLEGK